MFIETDTGRLQNLYLLQDVRVVENEENEDKPYSIGWVQANGVIIKEGEYTTLSDAEDKRDEIIEELIQTE